MVRRSRAGGFLAFGILTALGCSAQGGTDKVTYEDDVKPILRKSCLKCHNRDVAKAGLDVSSYRTILEGSESGKVVIAGAPDDSPLFLVINHMEEPFMPRAAPKLPRRDLETIHAWIETGLPEKSNSPVTVASSKNRATTADTKSRSAGSTGMKERPKSMSPSSAKTGRAASATVPVTRPEPIAEVLKTEPPRWMLASAGVIGRPPIPAFARPIPESSSARPTAVTGLAASPTAPLAAVSSQKQVRLFDTNTLRSVGALPFDEGEAFILRFSRDGRFLLAGGGEVGESGRAVVWDVVTGHRLAEVGEEVDTVLAADISPDGSLIAIGGPKRLVKVFSTASGKLLHTIKKHVDWVTSLEFSPDGVLLASGDRTGGLFAWEVPTAREFASLRGHTGSVSDLEWLAGGDLCASASEDGTLVLWDLNTARPRARWDAHAGGALGVAVTPDDRLVSCGRDRLAKLWDKRGRLIRTFGPVPDHALKVAATHDGKRLIVGDWSSQVSVWETETGKMSGSLESAPGKESTAR